MFKLKKQKMNILGVITGDIVKSGAIKNENREYLLTVLKSTFLEINKCILKEPELPFEIFRGDSFQAIIKKPELTLLVSMLIRCKLRSIDINNTRNRHSFKKNWDARIAIGIGGIDYTANKTIESDGQAFQLSGKTLDGMKDTEHCLKINTAWNDVNAEMNVAFAFADAIISDWSIFQAEAFYNILLTNATQKEISENLNISKVAIHLRLKTGKLECINLFKNRFENLIRSKL